MLSAPPASSQAFAASIKCHCPPCLESVSFSCPTRFCFPPPVLRGTLPSFPTNLPSSKMRGSPQFFQEKYLRGIFVPLLTVQFLHFFLQLPGSGPHFVPLPLFLFLFFFLKDFYLLEQFQGHREIEGKMQRVPMYPQPPMHSLPPSPSHQMARLWHLRSRQWPQRVAYIIVHSWP